MTLIKEQYKIYVEARTKMNEAKGHTTQQEGEEYLRGVLLVESASLSGTRKKVTAELSRAGRTLEQMAEESSKCDNAIDVENACKLLTFRETIVAFIDGSHESEEQEGGYAIVWTTLPTPLPLRATNETTLQYVTKCLRKITPAQHIRHDWGIIHNSVGKIGYRQEIGRVNAQTCEVYAFYKCLQTIQKEAMMAPIIIAYDATHIRRCVSRTNDVNPTMDPIDEETRKLYEQIHSFRCAEEQKRGQAGQRSVLPRITLKHVKGHGTDTAETSGNTMADQLAKESRQGETRDNRMWQNGRIKLWASLYEE
jgi:ribonuclease HI